MTHICVVKQTIIDSDNGLSPGRHQAIIWPNAGILLTGPLGTNFSGILIGIQTFSFKKMDLKMSSAKWRPFGLGLNVLNIRTGLRSSWDCKPWSDWFHTGFSALWCVMKTILQYKPSNSLIKEIDFSGFCWLSKSTLWHYGQLIYGWFAIVM